MRTLGFFVGCAALGWTIKDVPWPEWIAAVIAVYLMIWCHPDLRYAQGRAT